MKMGKTRKTSAKPAARAQISLEAKLKLQDQAYDRSCKIVRSTESVQDTVIETAEEWRRRLPPPIGNG